MQVAIMMECKQYCFQGYYVARLPYLVQQCVPVISGVCEVKVRER